MHVANSDAGRSRAQLRLATVPTKPSRASESQVQVHGYRRSRTGCPHQGANPVTSSHGLAFVYSIAIGLLIGIERERSHRGRPRQALGSRTFALLAAVGTLTALLGTWVVVAGAVVVGCLIIAGYRRTNSDDPGTTTEVAAFAVFLLGVLCVPDARLAAAVAIAFMVLLTGKARIHTFAREVVTDVEIDDAIKFLVIAFVILPLLPDRDIGPYGALNPSHIWLIVVTLTGISWVGYVAVRALGPRRGLLATGLASGFVSATATTASMGRLSRTPDQFAPAVAGAQVSSVATYAQLGVIITVVSPAVALHLAVPLVLGAAVLSLAAVLTYRRSSPSATQGGAPGNQSDGTGPSRGEHVPVIGGRAFALVPALILATVLTAALLVGRWGAAVLGPKGAVFASGAAGLADAHAGALSAATQFSRGVLGMGAALAAVSAALVANSIVKCVVAFVAGGGRFGGRFAFGLVPSVLTVVAGLGIVWLVST